MFDNPSILKGLTLLCILVFLLSAQAVYRHLTRESRRKNDEYLDAVEAEIEADEEQQIQQLVTQLKVGDLSGVKSGDFSISQIETANQRLIESAVIELEEMHEKVYGKKPRKGLYANLDISALQAERRKLAVKIIEIGEASNE